MTEPEWMRVFRSTTMPGLWRFYCSICATGWHAYNHPAAIEAADRHARFRHRGEGMTA